MNAAVSCGAAMWRWRMPVRSRIHSSEVSTVRDEFVVADRSLGQIGADTGEDRADGHRCFPYEAVRERAASAISGQVLADVVVEPVHHHVHRHVDRMGEAFGVGAAMRLHHHTIQPQHHRAVVAPRIEPFAQPIQRRAQQQIGQPGGEAAAEHLAQQVADQLQRALAGLQRDVAGEAVGHHHVGGAGGDVVALDEAVELRGDMAGAQRLGGAPQRVVALQLLGADIQQADGRRGQAKHGAGEHVAHDGELDQVAGVALHVGAEVQHHHVAARRGADGGHGRADRCPAAS